MSGLGPGTAIINNEPLLLFETGRASLCQSLVSSNTEGQPRTLTEIKKTSLAGSILVTTTTARTPSTTTTTTFNKCPASCQPSPTTRPKTSTTNSRTIALSSSAGLTTITRTPLQSRDNNAAPSRPTRPLKSPPDAAMSANNKPARQVQIPGLSVPAVRGLNKAPLTPKIAARGATSIPAAQHATSGVTPLSRRAQQRLDHSQSHNGREDAASPVNTFLASTVTPRSGSRQSRRETTSANSTPAGTPSAEDHDAWNMRTSAFPTSPNSSLHGDGLRRPGLPSDKDTDSKFFYASEASRPPITTQATHPSRQHQLKADAFVYANGANLPEMRHQATSTSSTPVLASPPVHQDDLMSKFVYADEGRDIPPAARPSVVNRKSGSVVSAASKAPAPRLGTPTTLGNILGHSQQRPVSPVKIGSYAPTKNNCAQSLPISRTNSNLGSVPSLGPAPVIQKRRSIPSADAARQPPVGRGHSRHGSVTTTTEAQPAIVARFMPSAIPSQPSSLPLSPAAGLSKSGPPTPGFPSPPPTASTGPAPSPPVAEDSSASGPNGAGKNTTAPMDLDSPAKISSQEQDLADLVTTARRERKVQDLEITNASLEAINRTLERQLRKQTAELRRYKRMSRVGRLSLNSVDPHEGRGSRVASNGSVAGGALARAGLSLEDLSEEEVSDLEADEMAEMAAEMDDEDDFSHSPSESEEMSPAARALRDAKHKRQDEQRLQLDLSKHQQLLVDSQKINQSLRRCLGWTEELIKEGRRALAYKVHVSEVELGGRVLSPEEIEARNHEDEELSVVDGAEGGMVHHAVRFNPKGAGKQDPWVKGSHDRDSGVDLPADRS